MVTQLLRFLLFFVDNREQESDNQGMEPFEGIGPALALLRKRSGQQQIDVAAAMGTTSASVSRWEAKDGAPNAKKIGAYLKAVKADAHDLADALDLVNGKTGRKRTTQGVSLGEGSDFLHNLVHEALLRGLKDLKEGDG